MNPSIDDLAVMAKEYHARIYERMSRNEDFLNIRVGHRRNHLQFQDELPASRRR